MFDSYRIGANAPSKYKPLTSAEIEARRGIGMARDGIAVAKSAKSASDWLGGKERSTFGYYSIGTGPRISKDQSAVGDFRIWEGIATPGFLKNEIEKLNKEIFSMSKEMASRLVEGGCAIQRGKVFDAPLIEPVKPEPEHCAKINAFYRDVWGPFWDSWLNFRDDYSGWWARLTGTGIHDQIMSYREKAITLYKRAKSIGFSFVGPEPDPPPSGNVREMGKWLKGIIILGLVGMGIWAAVRIAQALAKLWGSRAAITRARVRGKKASKPLIPGVKRGPGRPKGT